jgi:hypothetical protein
VFSHSVPLGGKGFFFRTDLFGMDVGEGSRVVPDSHGDIGRDLGHCGCEERGAGHLVKRNNVNVDVVPFRNYGMDSLFDDGNQRVFQAIKAL